MTELPPHLAVAGSPLVNGQGTRQVRRLGPHGGCIDVVLAFARHETRWRQSVVGSGLVMSWGWRWVEMSLNRCRYHVNPGQGDRFDDA